MERDHEPLVITDEMYRVGMSIVHPRPGSVDEIKDAARMFVPEQRNTSEENDCE